MEENNKIENILKQVENDGELMHELLKNCMNITNSDFAAAVASDFLNENYITNSNIAEIAKKSPQATLSMIKCNEKDFPKSFNIAGTNLYNKNEVVNWLINNNKIVRDKNDFVKQEFLYGTEKTVVFAGGPGNGKSTISATAAEESIVSILKRILTSGGIADTENLIKLHYKNNSVNYVIFHYGDPSNDSIPIKINEANIKRISDELEKCKKEAKKLRNNNDSDSKKMLLGTYVEFVLQPNKFVTKLMNECNIDVLTFVDTPGIDKEHSGESVSIAEADIVVIVLGDREDVKSIAEKVKTNIVPQTGTAQYIYLYNNRFPLNCNNSDDAECEEIYTEYLNDAKEDLKDYVDDLKNLQSDLVIGSTLSACKPLDSLICVPAFPKRPDATDEFFYNKFCKKLKEAFKNSIYFTELKNFNVVSLGNDFLNLLNEYLKKFVERLTKDKEPLYTISNFINEKHGRTKSLDNYIIEYNFNNALRDLKKNLYETFSKYETKNCTEEKMSVIRLVYLMLNEALMNKVHYGSGSHPWEDTASPTQMICEEVLSEDIIKNENKVNKNEYYCDILKRNGVKSKSWNYVYLNNTDWNRAKLIVSNKYKLSELKTENLMKYIEICHFIPSILVQSVLAYYKINPSDWKQEDFESEYIAVLDNIMEKVL